MRTFLYYIVAFFAILFIVVFQTHVIDGFEVLRFRVNFVLILTLYSTLAISLSAGIKISFFSGILLDIFSALPFGIFTASLLCSNLLIFALSRRFFVNRSMHSLLILITCGTITFLGIFFTITWLLVLLDWHPFVFHFTEIFSRALWQFFFNDMFSIIIFLALKTLRKQFLFTTHF